MKILLVSSQIIDDKGNYYKCSNNFYDIIHRFCYLGNLHICAIKFNGKNSHLKIDKELKGILDYGKVTFLEKNRLNMSKNNRRVIENLAKDVDLVISYGASYDVYVIAKKYNKKFMAFVVSCAWDAYWNHGWQGKILAPYKYLRARNTIYRADYVLYVSNEFLQKRYPSHAKYQAGCSNVKIPTMNDKTLSQRIRFLESWNGKELHLATTAAVDVLYKGQQFVIRALHEMRKKGRANIHYHLLGGGDKSFLSDLSQKLGVIDQVHFHGIIPHADVFILLDKMHIYIQPSLQEGLPRSVVEAMSRGLMCIGANTAAIPELIQPKYVTRRKSYTDIIEILENVTKEELIDQAKVNFNEAKNYQEELIGKRRNDFFDKIIKDIEN